MTKQITLSMEVNALFGSPKKVTLTKRLIYLSFLISYLTGVQKNDSVVTSYVQYTVQDNLSECFAKRLAHLHKRKKERFKERKLSKPQVGTL